MLFLNGSGEGGIDLQFLRHEIELWKRNRGYKGTTLQRRLILFFSMVAICIILLFTLLLILFGITGREEKTIYRYLETELLHISSALEEDLGNLSVTGIHLAELLSKEGARISKETQTELSDLLQNRDADLLSAQMKTLLSVAEHNPCGGVFLILDIPGEPDRLPGIFIKKTQPISSASFASKTYCLRGSADTARAHGVELLAQWQMDYDRKEIPFFENVLQTARENPELPLSRLYYWSGRLRLNGNSETGILLTLPLRSPNGTVYGVCGIEVSDRMFKQLYSPSESSYQSVFAIAAPEKNRSISAQNGLIAGNSYLTGNQMTSPLLFVGAEDHFYYYVGETNTYGGLQTNLKLYPTDSPYGIEQWSLSLLMPQSILKDAMRGNSSILFLIVAGLLAVSLISCVFLSRRYLRPIQQGLSSVWEKSYENETADFGLLEIDELFAELAQGIRSHRSELQQLQMEKQDVQAQMEKVQTQIDRLTDKKKQEINPEEFVLFLDSVKNLTATEKRIFDLYLEGKTPKEILEQLQIKENTLKYHNRNIYGKLGVSSRKQLLEFATLMENIGSTFIR